MMGRSVEGTSQGAACDRDAGRGAARLRQPGVTEGRKRTNSAPSHGPIHHHSPAHHPLCDLAQDRPRRGRAR
uniref:Uncharacterized protein n=1 Tax=Arundo donax TaxID=35708 RepID=A0A0A9CS98_ARUDO